MATVWRAGAGLTVAALAALGGLLGPGPTNADGNRTKVPDIHMYFAAQLSITMEAVGARPVDWSNVRQFELLCVNGMCFLEVLSVATEYCNENARPSGPESSGVNHDLVSNFLAGTGPLHVELIGNNTLSIQFRDSMLWGPTEESLVVSYADKYPRPEGMPSNSTKLATKIAGSASGLQASVQKPRAATYLPLSVPVFCTVGFWPTGR